MAVGDLTLTNHGIFELSAAGLKTAVDAINVTSESFISGTRIHLVSAGNGQVRVLEVRVT